MWATGSIESLNTGTIVVDVAQVKPPRPDGPTDGPTEGPIEAIGVGTGVGVAPSDGVALGDDAIATADGPGEPIGPAPGRARTISTKAIITAAAEASAARRSPLKKRENGEPTGSSGSRLSRSRRASGAPGREPWRRPSRSRDSTSSVDRFMRRLRPGRCRAHAGSRSGHGGAGT